MNYWLSVAQKIDRLWSTTCMARRTAILQSRQREKREGKFIHKCAHCNELFYLKEIQVDHIQPRGKKPQVAPFEDPAVWGNWIAKVWCSLENLQILCKPCHKIKTNKERK